MVESPWAGRQRLLGDHGDTRQPLKSSQPVRKNQALRHSYWNAFVSRRALAPVQRKQPGLAEIIHGTTLTRSVSEGVVTVRPRLRFGLVRDTAFSP